MKSEKKTKNDSRTQPQNADNNSMRNNNKENDIMSNLTSEQRVFISQVFDAMRDDREGNGAAKLATAKRLKGELEKMLAEKK